MSWREFEVLVGEGFRLQGYQVVENFEPGPDDGIDLMLRKDGEKYLVQCKQWRAFKVGVPVVRELYGTMAAKGAAGGFVVTSGRFTPEAEAFASGRNLRLLDGPQLHRLLKQARGGSSAKPNDRNQEKQVRNAALQAAKAAAPSCPRCAQSMVRRTARKGINAGQEFWGCSDYPRCRGTA
jgi:restriction system protein